MFEYWKSCKSKNINVRDMKVIKTNENLYEINESLRSLNKYIGEEPSCVVWGIIKI